MPCAGLPLATPKIGVGDSDGSQGHGRARFPKDANLIPDRRVVLRVRPKGRGPGGRGVRGPQKGCIPACGPRISVYACSCATIWEGCAKFGAGNSELVPNFLRTECRHSKHRTYSPLPLVGSGLLPVIMTTRSDVTSRSDLLLWQSVIAIPHSASGSICDEYRRNISCTWHCPHHRPQTGRPQVPHGDQGHPPWTCCLCAVIGGESRPRAASTSSLNVRTLMPRGVEHCRS